MNRAMSIMRFAALIPDKTNQVDRTKITSLVMIVLTSSGLIVGSINLVSSRFGQSAHEPAVHFVGGEVLVNGEPAPNVNVAFHPLDSARNRACPVGRTNGQGMFVLALSSAKLGACEGEYSVTFVWPDPTIVFDECECPDPLIHDRFKGMYARAKDSTYRVRVDANSTTFNFSLWRPRSEDPLP